MARSDREAKITFKAETAQFDDALKASAGNMRELKSEVALADAQLKNDANDTQALENKSRALAAQLDENASKQEALNGKLEAARKVYGDDSVQVQNLQTALNRAKTEEEAIKGKLDATNTALEKQKGDVSAASTDWGDLAGQLTEAGKGMTAISAGIVAAGKGAMDAYSEVKEGTDAAIKATGATDEQAEALKESFKNVASEVAGDFGEIGAAMGEVSTRFGFTGQDLEDATAQFVRFADIAGTDAATAVDNVNRYMRAAGIESSEYGTVLDKLAAAGQASGISVDKLSTSIVSLGPTLSALGYTTDEQIALLSQFELAGVDSQTAITGMKRAATQFAKDGDDVATAWANMVTGIQEGTVSLDEVVDIFGSRSAMALYQAAQNGKLSIGDMMTAVEAAGGTVDATMGEIEDGTYKVTIAQQNMKIAAGEAGSSIMTALVPVINAATKVMQAFTRIWNAIPGPIQTTLVVILGIVAAIGPLLLLGGQMIKTFQAIGAILPVLTSAFRALGVAMTANPIGLIIAAVAVLIGVFTYLWNHCEGFRNFWIGLWDGIVEKVEQAKAFISNIVETIKGIFKGEIEPPHLKMPHITITPEGWSFFKMLSGDVGLPHLSVSWYAKGGIVNGATLIGAGEKGAEAIMPLSGRYMAPFAQAVSDRMEARAVNVYIDRATVNSTPAIQETVYDLLTELEHIATMKGGEYA